MNEKHEKNINEKIEEIMEERKILKDFRKRCVIDRMNKENDKKLQKIELLTQNDRIMSENIVKKLKVHDEKVNEKINYFPFTHGDALEKQQSEVRNQMKERLIELNKMKNFD